MVEEEEKGEAEKENLVPTWQCYDGVDAKDE